MFVSRLVALASTLIVNIRFLFDGKLRLNKVPHYDIPVSGLVEHPMQASVQKALEYPLGGVSVLWGPGGSGKSTMAALAASAHASNGHYVAVLDGASTLFDKDQWAPTWLRYALGIQSTGWGWGVYPQKFSDLFPARVVSFDKDPHAAPPTAIVITNFDHLMEINGTESMVSALADMSYRTKRFNVMLCVQSWKNAEAILTWNDRYKIRLVDCAERGMWQPDHIQDLLLRLAPSLEHWTDDAKDALQRLGAIAGTPGFINAVAASEMRDSDREWLADKASSLAQQWQQGARALSYLHSEERCPNSEL